MAGNPNPKGCKPDKLMRDAILVALNREAELNGQPTRRLYVVADQLVSLAMTGDIQAIKEINDRIDGKATQTIAGDQENPLFSVEILRELLGTKLDRISLASPESEPQNRLN